jgi:hypothetical protein
MSKEIVIFMLLFESAKMAVVLSHLLFGTEFVGKAAKQRWLQSSGDVARWVR